MARFAGRDWMVYTLPGFIISAIEVIAATEDDDSNLAKFLFP
jgi:hypothetical protein